MTFDSLEGKVVLVTGGARGIGKGLAAACLAEGAKVIITNLNADVGRQAQDELSALGHVRSVRCDSTDRADVDALLDDIWRNEGPLDLVFSNAGTGGRQRVLEASIEEVRDLMATNFESAVHIAQSCIPRMLREGKPAHVMFTASEHAVGLPAGNEDLGFAFYGVSKHAMLIFAEWLRADLAGTNVSVSLLLPGPVLTEGVVAAFTQLDQNPNDPAIRAVFSRTVEQLLRARAISTAQCAQMALKGLRAGLFYIPTQSHIQQDVDRRHREMTAAFERMGLSG
jgi:NAD(P)-dependent dehydrogenase (short-subunit alcohol dehydrogenase family)